MGPLQAVLFVEPRVIAVLMEAEFPLCKSRMMACLWYGYDGSNHSVFILMPERDSGIVMVANASGFERKPQINQVAEGIISLLNGKSPASVVAPSIYRFLYWAILLRPLLMLVGIFYSWRRWRDKGAGYQLLVVSLHGGVASLWLSAMPLVIGQPIWTGMRFFLSELSYGLIAGAAIGIGRSLIYAVMILRARRAGRPIL